MRSKLPLLLCLTVLIQSSVLLLQSSSYVEIDSILDDETERDALAALMDFYSDRAENQVTSIVACIFGLYALLAVVQGFRLESSKWYVALLFLLGVYSVIGLYGIHCLEQFYYYVDIADKIQAIFDPYLKDLTVPGENVTFGEYRQDRWRIIPKYLLRSPLWVGIVTFLVIALPAFIVFGRKFSGICSERQSIDQISENSDLPVDARHLQMKEKRGKEEDVPEIVKEWIEGNPAEFRERDELLYRPRILDRCKKFLFAPDNYLKTMLKTFPDATKWYFGVFQTVFVAGVLGFFISLSLLTTNNFLAWVPEHPTDLTIVGWLLPACICLLTLLSVVIHRKETQSSILSDLIQRHLRIMHNLKELQIEIYYVSKILEIRESMEKGRKHE